MRIKQGRIAGIKGMGLFCIAGKALIKYQYPSIEKETIL